MCKAHLHDGKAGHGRRCSYARLHLSQHLSPTLLPLSWGDRWAFGGQERGFELRDLPSWGTGLFWAWQLKLFCSCLCISGQASSFLGMEHLPPHQILLISSIYLKYPPELLIFTIQPAHYQLAVYRNSIFQLWAIYWNEVTQTN